jgi:very-short-patch-repair endonuclease
MRKDRIFTRDELTLYRRKLRNNSTSAEAVLWLQLKHSQLLGRKFRRQHSAAHYIMDFYCPSEKLAIELDGAHHYTEEGLRKDAERTKYLNSLGVTVIRFENKWVFEDMEYVLAEIKKHFSNT